MSEFDENNEGELATVVKTKIKPPSLYKVLLINDNFTPMDFVIYVLVNIFEKSYDESEKLMLTIHNQGKGIAGIYSFQVAETKADQVNQLAKQYGHPLDVKVEEHK